MALTCSGKMLVAAHRGDSFNHYENTMGAFRAAIESGADMIETDVRLTKDGVLVLSHEENVYKATGVPGKISEMSFEELRKLNFGGADEFEQIPTLEEFMELLIALLSTEWMTKATLSILLRKLTKQIFKQFGACL